MNTRSHITAFYKFKTLNEEEVKALQAKLKTFGEQSDMRGLVLLAHEGINGTVSGPAESIAAWKNMLTEEFGEIEFKDSQAEKTVYARWHVKIRPEIVTIQSPEVRPAGKRNHLSPEEWEEMLQKEDVVLIDTRNYYETSIGMFKGAVDPNLTQFHDFPEYVSKANLPKDKKILMYCTGGIRCEKALIEMERQGYENVFQLDGGILAYLEKFPHRHFEGECFVFDRRVAVQQDLSPSERFGTCPHCGNPGDVSIRCGKCDCECKVCAQCHQNELQRSCSKNCRYLLSRVRQGEKAEMRA